MVRRAEIVIEISRVGVDMERVGLVGVVELGDHEVISSDL